jgi:hypothetical protein
LDRFTIQTTDSTTGTSLPSATRSRDGADSFLEGHRRVGAPGLIQVDYVDAEPL